MPQSRKKRKAEWMQNVLPVGLLDAEEALAAEAEAAGQPLDREKNGYMGGLLIALDALKKMMVERAKSDWTAKGNSLDDVKDLALYINASEGMVYYVVNDDYLSGSFAF